VGAQPTRHLKKRRTHECAPLILQTGQV